jgi:septal ring factor EnvC (AmiA/AmiB activator)
MNHVTWLENMLVQAKSEEAHANRNTENRHCVIERKYEAANARVVEARDRLAQLRQMVIDQKSLLEACENEVCQLLSDFDESHMEWRNSRAHSTQGVNSQ